MNTLTVQLTGDADEVDDIKLCLDGECSPGHHDDPDPADLQVVSSHARANGSDAWTVTLGSAPEEVNVRTYTASRAVLTDTSVAPDWQRVGGSAECGGPLDATVTVNV